MQTPNTCVHNKKVALFIVWYDAIFNKTRLSHVCDVRSILQQWNNTITSRYKNSKQSPNSVFVEMTTVGHLWSTWKCVSCNTLGHTIDRHVTITFYLGKYHIKHLFNWWVLNNWYLHMKDPFQDQNLPAYTVLPFWPSTRKWGSPSWHRILRTHLPVPYWQRSRTNTLRHWMTVSCISKYTQTFLMCCNDRTQQYDSVADREDNNHSSLNTLHYKLLALYPVLTSPASDCSHLEPQTYTYII